MTAIINYGVGNLFSLVSSLRYLGLDCKVTSSAEDILSADRVILPGVGAFGDAAARLSESLLIPAVRQCVSKGTPLLGICVGMQLLFDQSFEHGRFEGLGIIPGSICSLEQDLAGLGLKVPQIGWNSLQLEKPGCPLFKYTGEGEFFYYVHSYYAKDCDEFIAADSEYGVRVPGVVWKGNVFGTQFHPEKSGSCGLSMLKAFSELER